MELQVKTIDRSSRIPYYIQLKERLVSVIEEEKWEPGQLITTELELCERYKVSRATVRKALDELVFEGVFERRKAKGIYVAMPKIKEGMLQSLEGVYEYQKRGGTPPVSRVECCEMIVPPSAISRILGIGEYESALYIERLRFLDGEPFVISKNYFHPKVCTNIPADRLITESLYAILDQLYGIKFVRAYRTIEMAWPTTQEAKLLRTPQGVPVQLLKSVAYLEDGTVGEYLYGVFRGDRCRFEVELER